MSRVLFFGVGESRSPAQPQLQELAMSTIHPDGSETEGRSLARLELELKLLKARPIAGNAYSDHNLLNALPDLAIEAASQNHPDLAFEAWDALTPVVGGPALEWEGRDGFVACMTCWHEHSA